ncbi:MAG TPA: hypothetical protein VKK81_15005 [Candidatus Binatia bacterium]|nr:hypothetical protein [Candidatus Binatia bacterium]
MRQPKPVNKSVHLLWGVIVFLSLVSLAAQAGEDIATGMALFEGGQFAAAPQFFEAFVRQYPTDPSGAYYLFSICQGIQLLLKQRPQLLLFFGIGLWRA